MRFISLALLAGAAVAVPLIEERNAPAIEALIQQGSNQYRGLQNALNSIGQSTIARGDVQSAANTYAANQVAVQQLISQAIGAAQSDPRVLSIGDSTAIVINAASLFGSVANTLSAYRRLKPTMDQIGLTSNILQDLQSQKTGFDNAIKAVGATVANVYYPFVPVVQKLVDNIFDNAINTYGAGTQPQYAPQPQPASQYQPQSTYLPSSQPTYQPASQSTYQAPSQPTYQPQSTYYPYPSAAPAPQ